MDMVKKFKIKQLSVGAAIGIGIGTSAVLSMAILALAALLVSTEKLQINAIPVVIAFTHLVSAFAGTFLACKLADQKLLITGSAAAGGYFLTLLTLTAILFSGEYQGVLTGLLMVAIGAAAAVLTGLRKEKGSARKHKIPAYR